MLRGEKRMTHYYEGFPQSDRDEKIKMVNVDELEERVKKVMPEGAYYYIASGAENEWTWRNNTAAFNHFQVVPRALTDMADPQTNTDFMGMHLKTPIMIAPIACMELHIKMRKSQRKRVLLWLVRSLVLVLMLIRV